MCGLTGVLHPNHNDIIKDMCKYCENENYQNQLAIIIVDYFDQNIYLDKQKENNEVQLNYYYNDFENFSLNFGHKNPIQKMVLFGKMLNQIS